MRLPFKGTFPLTQGFGVNPEYYSQFLVKQPDGTTGPLKGHNGLDYGLPTGTEVIAPHAGKIIEAAFDQKGYGNYIKIENAEMGSVLGHLEKIDVQVGQEVQEGDHLGLSDNTGYSTGSHSHWGWYPIPRDRSNGYGGFCDQSGKIDTTTPSSSAPVSGKLYTDEEYQACITDRNNFWKQRDELITAGEEIKKQLTEKTQQLTAFAALGYPTVDDVTKKTKELEDTNTGLQTQIKQTLDRNMVLLDLLKKKEEEDSTAIDAGMSAQSDLKDAKHNMEKIAKTVDTTPDANEIIKKFDYLKRIAEWGEKLLKKKEDEQKNIEKVIIENVSSWSSLFDQLLGFTRGGVNL